MSLVLIRRPHRIVMAGLAVAVTAFFWLLAFHAGGAYAGTPKVYTGTNVTVTRTSHGKTLPRGLTPNVSVTACADEMDLAPTGCSGLGGGDDSAQPATGADAPDVPNNLTARGGSGSTTAGWNGVYNTQNAPLNDGYEYTPPDQGLCVGPASALSGLALPVPGNTSVVVEPVNDVYSVYSTTGALLYGPDSLADLFYDEYSTGDVSCNYDPATKSFYFTEIGFDGEAAWTDLAVLNSSGYATYELDTGFEGECFPDFPHQGFDNNALYLSVNEFCGPYEEYEGGALFGLSKSQLASLALDVNYTWWDDIFSFTLQPAIGDGTNTEYLLASDGYDDSSNFLDFWHVARDNNITKGVGPVYLYYDASPRSENYAVPVWADSTGDGSCTTYDGNDFCTTSESQLNPDDDRLEQVQYSGGYLYTSLNTSLDFNTTGDAQGGIWDGGAWFRVNTKTIRIDRQGYVGVDGTNLLYPSFGESQHGTYFMDFSMTSPTLDPSTGYTFSKNLGNTFAAITTTGEGTGPHMSFAEDLGYDGRWGDYSWMAFDPASSTVWMADEYVPPDDGNGGGGADTVDNWGTYVWSVGG